MSDNKDKVNEESIKKFEKDYSEESFFDKILKYAKVIGVNLIYKALQLYYVLQKPDVPAADKGIIIAALGYLISPLDFIPDPIPVNDRKRCLKTNLPKSAVNSCSRFEYKLPVL